MTDPIARDTGASATPSCPSCGESPMFRSQVHGCCVEVENLRATLLAVREALFDTTVVAEAQVRAAIRALNAKTDEQERCAHNSESGDEGPVRDLDRMPTRWRCDQCGRVRHDDPCLCDSCTSARTDSTTPDAAA